MALITGNGSRNLLWGQSHERTLFDLKLELFGPRKGTEQ